MARRSGRGTGRFRDDEWPAYVPVAARRQRAEKEAAALRKKGVTVTPVRIQGTKISSTFWGKAWCENLESYSDYANRLPRGRSYARSGAIVHLEIGQGKVEALVQGTKMYTVKLGIKALPRHRWDAVVDQCSGQVASLVELLAGRLPHGVMEIVTSKARGIFPSPSEISLTCSCPDWATMCKHVAAAMYGVGSRLDHEPGLLFVLRGVDPAQLVARSVGRAAATASRPRGPALADSAMALGDIFGIEIDEGAPKAAAPKAARRRAAPPRKPAAQPPEKEKRTKKAR